VELVIGQEIESTHVLYYVAQDKSGRSGQGILQNNEWVTVTEIDKEKGYHLVGRHDDLWIDIDYLSKIFDRYFVTLDQIKIQKNAIEFVKTTKDIELLRKLALTVDVDKIILEVSEK
jgi:hypothetical protein